MGARSGAAVRRAGLTRRFGSSWARAELTLPVPQGLGSTHDVTLTYSVSAGGVRCGVQCVCARSLSTASCPTHPQPHTLTQLCEASSGWPPQAHSPRRHHHLHHLHHHQSNCSARSSVLCPDPFSNCGFTAGIRVSFSHARTRAGSATPAL
eukprot:18904-Rhodomonas_salina.1